MLLKIYTLTLGIKEPESIDNLHKTNFLKDPITAGEIVWNFLEHEIIKADSREEFELEGFAKILFRWLLPYIAYTVEKQEKFHFTIGDLEEHIGKFVTHVKGIDKKPDDLNFYEPTLYALDNKTGKTRFLLEKCVNNFSIIKLKPVEGVKENTYSFIHQYFRDIFSATHIKNQMNLQDKSVFTDRILPFYISQMLLEILQEHKSAKPLKLKEQTLLNEPSSLREYLKNFKNEAGNKAQIGVFNALQIINYSCKGNLSNEDFSELDLRMCSLVEKDIRGSKFVGSHINRKTFFSNGHTSSVNNVTYSPDGVFLASASHDRTIKIWKRNKADNKFVLVDTLKGLEGHTAGVNCVCYSPDGLYLASASHDRTVRVWERNKANDKFVLVDALEGHTACVRSGIYSPDRDGVFLASASHDRTVRIWE
ncbi:MAG: hypothetical protein FWG55_00560, partial [Candidatus Bathyarchaeota archaeon]|nr:hypothetical protein [Candidatus Termiticorpusculum sp.]